jgi:predicted nuclease of predicted toxin-antitoxin system
MRFLVDENIAGLLVSKMRKEGWDVTRISEISPGVNDDVVVKIAKESQRVLITADVELASRTLRDEQLNIPTILLRLDNLDFNSATELVVNTIKQRTDWILLHSVITPRKLRTRLKT